MPTYNYHCLSCGLEYEQVVPIVKRDEFIEPFEGQQCHLDENGHGADQGGEWKPCQWERYLPSPPGMGDPMRLGRKKAPRDFNDLLKGMAKKHPRNNIHTY